MQNELINDLFSAVNSQIFKIVLQLIIVGAVLMWIKDLNGRVVNFIKLRMSDFGRGTKIIIDNKEGYINKIGFDEVEIIIDDSKMLFIPVDKFIHSNKIIITNGLEPRKKI